MVQSFGILAPLDVLFASTSAAWVLWRGSRTPAPVPKKNWRTTSTPGARQDTRPQLDKRLQTSSDIFRHSMETFEETLTRWQQNPENKCYKTLRMWTKKRKASEKHQKSIRKASKLSWFVFFKTCSAALPGRPGIWTHTSHRRFGSQTGRLRFVFRVRLSSFRPWIPWLPDLMSRGCPDCFRLSFIFICFPLSSSVFMSWNSGVFCFWICWHEQTNHDPWQNFAPASCGGKTSRWNGMERGCAMFQTWTGPGLIHVFPSANGGWPQNVWLLGLL